MSSQGLESGHRPGSCGLGGCLCHGQGSDAANLPIWDNTMPTFSRRHVVRAALGGAMAATISGVEAASRSASAQSTMSPDDALKAVERLATLTPDLECAPGAGQDQAAGLTVCRAWWSSNWAGLR
jgi:hypothetical protein